MTLIESASLCKFLQVFQELAVSLHVWINLLQEAFGLFCLVCVCVCVDGWLIQWTLYKSWNLLTLATSTQLVGLKRQHSGVRGLYKLVMISTCVISQWGGLARLLCKRQQHADGCWHGWQALQGCIECITPFKTQLLVHAICRQHCTL